jgi:cytochrome P450
MTVDASAGDAIRPIPGPAGVPLLGSIPAFRRDQPGFLVHLAREYGSVARFRLGPIAIVLVSDPEGIQRVLQKRDHAYQKGPLWDVIRNVAGHGLFTSEGPHWLHQRRLMQPTFHRQVIAGFADLMVRQTERTLEGWERAAATGEPIDVGREMATLTMRIVAEAMFHADLDEELDELSAAITWLLADIDFRVEVPFYPGLGVPTLRNRRTQRELRVIDAAIERVIAARRQRGEHHDDLLGMLMAAVDEETGEPMTDRQLRDEVVTIFVAGHETTAVLLTWLFHRLAAEPEWEERLAREVRAVLDDRRPGADDVAQLPTVRMAIDETLRLYPPVWITNRTAVEDDVLDGYAIDSGTTVAISPYVTHRDATYWPDPERFDPTRFAADTASRPRFAFLPFGGGPHLCIGNGFALLEAPLIFACVAQRYRLSPVPGTAIGLAPGTTLRPDRPVMMTVHRRVPTADGPVPSDATRAVPPDGDEAATVRLPR